MKMIMKAIAIGVLALVPFTAANAATATYGFELWGSAKGKKGVFELRNTGDAEIIGMTMGIGKKRFDFKGSGDEMSLSAAMLNGSGATSFKVKTVKDSNNKAKKFSKVLFNNGLSENGWISVDFSVNGLTQSLRVDLNDLSDKLFKGKYKGVMQMLAYGPQAAINALENPGDIIGYSNIAPLEVVPLPAALPLMLGGLFGLGVMGRRRKV